MKRGNQITRTLPVREITPEECSDLLYHAHDCSVERQRAYLLKASRTQEVYFTPEDFNKISAWIENEQPNKCTICGHPCYGGTMHHKCPVTPVAGPVGSKFAAWLDADGKLFLQGAVHATHACGCRVVGNATLPHPLDIQYCEAHGGLAQRLIDGAAALGLGKDTPVEGAEVVDWLNQSVLPFAAKIATPTRCIEQEVADELAKLGASATYEHPGYLHISAGRSLYWAICETDNESPGEWHGQLTNGDGLEAGHIGFSFPPDYTAAQIAEIIRDAIRG